MVLKAIVEEYVSTNEPVGSRTLSKRPDLPFSPATIRNDMADLEEMGYLKNPHFQRTDSFGSGISVVCRTNHERKTRAGSCLSDA